MARNWKVISRKGVGPQLRGSPPANQNPEAFRRKHAMLGRGACRLDRGCGIRRVRGFLGSLPAGFVVKAKGPIPESSSLGGCLAASKPTPNQSIVGGF